MPFPKKHENSKVTAFRLPGEVIDFLRSNFEKGQGVNKYTANDFVLKLISSSNEFQAYKARKAQDNNQPTLFPA